MAEPANIVEPEDAEEKKAPGPSGPSVALGNRFQIYPSTPIAEMSSASVRAFAASDTRDPGVARVALVCGPELPARLEGAKGMKSIDRPGLLRLYDFGLVDWPGASGKRLVLIYDFPEGGPLWSATGPRDPWTPPKLVSHLLNPISNALAEMFLRNVPHRSVRPQNLFWLDQARTRVVLGPCLAVPPGYEQPAAFETIECAMADPEARGEATRANDMFALGMTLMSFAQGSLPAGLDPEEAISRRVERGSFDTYCDMNKIPAVLMEVLRGLTNDWEGDRWTIEMLRGWIDGKRQQSTQTAPPLLRAATGYKFGGRDYKNPRDLAHGLGKRWESAARELRTGNVAMWVRNTLGDQKLHDRIVAAIKEPTGDPNPTFNDATIVARVSILLDPMAPIRFRGHSITLDGMGTALAAAMRKPGMGPIFADIIRARLPGAWAHFHKMAGGKNGPPNGFVERLSKWIDDPAPGNGIERCLYELNPNLPCFSEMAAGLWVSEPDQVLEALEASAGANRKPIDRHIAAFLAVHAGAEPGQIKALMNPDHVDMQGGLSIVRLLADLQEKFGPPSVPKLTAWCAGLVRQFVDGLKHLPLRAAQLAQLNKVSEDGDLKQLLELVDNEKMREVDSWGYDAAREAYAACEAEIVEIRNGAQARAQYAKRTGKETAALTAASLSGVVGIGSLLLRLF
jgi:hypothetical protein